MSDWKEALDRWERMVREGAYADAWEGELDSILGVRAHIERQREQIEAAREERDALRRVLGRILENEAPDYKFAEEFGGYVLDDELREEARRAVHGGGLSND